VTLPSSKNAVSFSSTRTFLHEPSRDQTHCELVYRPFQFQKRRQYFVGAHNETLSVAMRVHNPDRSAFAIHS
jgi:hypothetical protein